MGQPGRAQHAAVTARVNKDVLQVKQTGRIGIAQAEQAGGESGCFRARPGWPAQEPWRVGSARALGHACVSRLPAPLNHKRITLPLSLLAFITALSLTPLLTLP
jgi:hypothetical protein